MGALVLLVGVAVALVVVWSVVVAPIIYLLTPALERKAIVADVTEDTKTKVTISHPSEPYSRKTQTSTNYSVALRFEDGTSGEFSCSRSMYRRLNRGDHIIARTKRRNLTGVK
jgi:hypothetical protein